MVSANGHVIALTRGTITHAGAEVWSLVVDSRLQRWNISAEGWENLLLDQDIGAILRPAIRDAIPSAPYQDNLLDLELVNLALEDPTLPTSGAFVVLVSYAGQQEFSAINIDNPCRRLHALVWMSFSSDTFTVDSVVNVPYQSVCFQLFRNINKLKHFTFRTVSLEHQCMPAYT